MNETNHMLDAKTKKKIKAYEEKILSLEADNNQLREKHFKALEYWHDEYSKLLHLSQNIKEENASLKSKMDDIHKDIARLMKKIHT